VDRVTLETSVVSLDLVSPAREALSAGTTA
jgi:hypothetical protein